MTHAECFVVPIHYSHDPEKDDRWAALIVDLVKAGYAFARAVRAMSDGKPTDADLNTLSNARKVLVLAALALEDDHA